jgi:putative aldouronate transport system permease protein
MDGSIDIKRPPVRIAKVKKSKSKGLRVPTTMLHLMLLPAALVIFIYNYLPMLGIVIAFQEYDVGKGLSAFWTSTFVGLDNFTRLFGDPDFSRAFTNTLVIATLKIVIGFVFPITIAILLNEIRKSMVKRTIQTLIYLPHFISWIILAGLVKDIFGMDGIVNTTLQKLFNLEPRLWLGENAPFLAILISTNLWKEFGFNTIVYLAAITSIDPNLYEAAIVDGAGRVRQTWHITLPGMRPIIVLTGVLALGGILNAGFDQIYNLYSVPVYGVADVIDTLAFRKGFQGGDYSFGAAIGLFNSAIAMLLIVSSYWMARKFAHYEIF